MISEIFSLKKLKNFLSMSISLIGIQWTVCLPYIICTLYMGQIQDPLPLAIFGLSCTFINVTFTSLILGIQETMGIRNTRYYSEKNYRAMSITFYRSIIIAIFLVFIFVFLAFNSFKILSFLSIQKELAFRSSELLVKCIPYIFLQALNQIIENFISSQNISKPLMIINFVSILNVLIFGQIFFIYFDCRESSFAYTKIMHEAINLVIFIILLAKVVNKETLITPRFSEIFHGFGTYLKKSFVSILSYYGEFLNFECNTYFAALLHNVDELDIWIIITNYSVIYYFTSIGLGFSIRNLVGFKIGEKKVTEGKKDAKIYYFYVLCVSIVIIFLQNVYKTNIANIYTKNVNLLPNVEKNIFIYGFVIFPNFVIQSLGSLLRLNHLDKFQFVFNVIFYPLSGAIFSYFFCFTMGMKTRGLTLGFTLCKTLVVIIFAMKLFYYLDWEKAQKDYQNNKSRSILQLDDVEDIEEILLEEIPK